MADRTGASASDKTFAVLEALVEQSRLTDIAAAAKLPKATVHRILQVMVERGLARPGGNGDYFTGPRMLALAGRVMHRLDLPARVRPELEELQRRTGRTVHLALLHGDEAVYVAKVEGGKPYQLASRVGMSLDLHSTSIGKAVLAAMDDDRVAALAGRTGLRRHTSETIVEVGPLLAELATVRARGWAEDHEENEPGVRAAGAAVYDHTGHVIGGVSAAALRYEAADQPAEEVGRQVVEAAGQVSRALGARAVPAAPGAVGPGPGGD
ncbi:IclR family transcriptional regulator [Plantactinospora sp. WMMB334]|uniref:IclR family transcriptional regulator n=1 Tax=Plantactinospora sp. WMMB334 TaxID=3404119 RepID=UPI003B940720